MRREVIARETARRSVGIPPPDRLTDGVVTLRLPDRTDIPILTRYGTDPGLLEGAWIGPHPEGDPARWAARRIEEMLAGWTEAGSIEGGGLVIDEAAPFVGISEFVPRSPGSLEPAYGVVPSARGRGIATRAMRLATDWALSAGRCRRIELRVAAGNTASHRVAQKAGFHLEERYEALVEATGLTFIDMLYARFIETPGATT
jgi:[ribosomal protein S5]-alanine N-acetyltransferase